jgi:hypothetical protein
VNGTSSIGGWVGTRVTGHGTVQSQASVLIELPTSNLCVGFEVRDGEYQGLYGLLGCDSV